MRCLQNWKLIAIGVSIIVTLCQALKQGMFEEY